MFKKVYLDNSTGIEVCEKPNRDYKSFEKGEKCFIIEFDKVKLNTNNYRSYTEKNNEDKFIPVIFLNRILHKRDEDGRGYSELFTVQRLDKNNEEMTFNESKYYFKI